MNIRFFRLLPVVSGTRLALFLGGALAVCPVAAAAEGRHLALTYDVYVGGMRTLNITYDAHLKPATYDMKMTLKGRGLLDWWFSWTMNAFSEGRVDSDAIVPVRAGAVSSWSGKNRETLITYREGGLPRVDISPQREEDEGDRRPPVPPDLRKGARDLAGGVLAALKRVGATGRCDVREPVFDGRRRFDLVLEHLGEDALGATGYSPFSGVALRCRISIDRIAGYRERERESRWRSKDEATIWLGRPFAGALPVPVRMEMETLVGALRAYLSGATVTAEGSTESLAAAR